MKSGALRRALLILAEAAAAGADWRLHRPLSEPSEMGFTANLVAGLVELDDIRKSSGEEGNVTSSFFMRFVAKAVAAEDNTKSVEKQAEMANSGNDK